MAEVKRIEVVLALAVAGLYAAQDAVGAAFEIPGVVDHPGKGGQILQAAIHDKDAQAAAGTLFIFNAQPAGIVDNSAYNPADAEADKYIGHVNFVAGDYGGAGGSNFRNAVKDVNIDFETLANSRSLWGVWVTSGAPTHVNGNVKVVLHVTQEEKAGRD